MKVNDEIVDRMAELAKLTFEDQAHKAIKHDLARILELCEKLNEIDTTEVKPLVYMSESVNSFREDKAYGKLSKEDVLKNAPEKDSDYIKVPRFLDRDKK